MKRIILLLLLGCLPKECLWAAIDQKADLRRVFCMRPQALAESKARVARGDEALNPALEALVRDADTALKAGPFSVMDKILTPPSGDKHDYLSFGPYWWPDPKKPDGLPYIRRDGEVNPESRGRRSDRDGLGGMASAVETLALAHYFTGKGDYAEHAAMLLRAWFLDKATRMNPHLQYGQAIPGRVEGRGIGLIDTTRLARVVDAVGLLGASSAWTEADQEGLEAWFAAFLDWMLTSGHGRDEARAANNHGTWYDVQVASFAMFLGREDLARRTVEGVRRRIDSQIRPDGSQPHELARTRSLGYSTMNLRGFFQLAVLGEHVGVDLWRYRGPDGQGLKPALDFIAPYADADTQWPHKQISHFNRMGMLELLADGVRIYQDKTYKELIRRLPADEVAMNRARLTMAAGW